MQYFCTLFGFAFPASRIASSRFFVFLRLALHEIGDFVFANQRYGAAAKSGARHATAEDSVLDASPISKPIKFGAGDFIQVAQ